MKGVGSFRQWGQVVGTAGKQLHHWLSVSDEAWFLLVIENYEDVWRAAMEDDRGGQGDGDAVVPKAKWTGKDKNNNRRGKGKRCFVLVADSLLGCTFCFVDVRAHNTCVI
jgi:hypothetical protein